VAHGDEPLLAMNYPCAYLENQLVSGSRA